MTRNHNCVVGRHSDVVFRRANGPVDAAASHIVDERIDAVPEGVTSLQDVSFGEIDRHVAIGVATLVMADQDRFTVQIHLLIAGDDLVREFGRRDRRECMFPLNDPDCSSAMIVAPARRAKPSPSA